MRSTQKYLHPNNQIKRQEKKPDNRHTLARANSVGTKLKPRTHCQPSDPAEREAPNKSRTAAVGELNCPGKPRVDFPRGVVRPNNRAPGWRGKKKETRDSSSSAAAKKRKRKPGRQMSFQWKLGARGSFRDGKGLATSPLLCAAWDALAGSPRAPPRDSDAPSAYSPSTVHWSVQSPR